MKQDPLYITRIEEYEEKILLKTVEDIFQNWQLDSKIGRGDDVLLKVNLLRGADPEEAVTTHPELAAAVARAVKDCGGRAILGDSPGGPFNQTLLKRAYRQSGYLPGEEKGLYELNYNTEDYCLEIPDGYRAKSLPVGEYIKQADYIINLPKLKTHGLTRYTGAVKNMFGAVAGLKKAEYHLNFPDAREMSHLFLDIYQALSPDLNILDGITGMEGAGPGSGTPKNFGVIAASTGIELDLVITYLLVAGENFWQEPLPAACRERGIEFSFADYQVPEWLEKELNQASIPDIENSRALLSENWPGFIHSLINKLLRPRPEFIEENCVACGKCRQNCPPEVITIEAGKAQADLSGCIRCFCCQEICPYNAIEINRPFLGRLFFT